MVDNTVSDVERMTIVRVFDAPRELVWKAWTEPELVKQWWGPKGFTCPACTVDFRVGGKYLYCMRSPEGQEFWSGGEYVEIVPLEKIVSSMYFADKDGNRVEASEVGVEHEAIDDEPNVILFEEVERGKTRLTFIGNERMEDAVKSGQVEGWKEILDKLAEVVGRG